MLEKLDFKMLTCSLHGSESTCVCNASEFVQKKKGVVKFCFLFCRWPYARVQLLRHGLMAMLFEKLPCVDL